MAEGAAQEAAMKKLAEDEAHAKMKAEEARKIEEYEEHREEDAAEKAAEIEKAMEDHNGEVPVDALNKMSEEQVKDIAVAAAADADG